MYVCMYKETFDSSLQNWIRTLFRRSIIITFFSQSMTLFFPNNAQY